MLRMTPHGRRNGGAIEALRLLASRPSAEMRSISAAQRRRKEKAGANDAAASKSASPLLHSSPSFSNQSAIDAIENRS